MSNGHVIDLRNPQPVQGLSTGQRHRIIVRREVIPIVFVPGIMGSRLKKRDGTGWTKVWDPDDDWFMVKTFGAFRIGPAQKTATMIGPSFDPEYLQVYTDDAVHNEKHVKRPGWIERGWGGVAWGIYGEMLQHLDLLEPPGLLPGLLSYGGRPASETPVHAFGYNWTASNDTSGAKLAAYIQQTIEQYRQQGRLCSQVILVTHSMGGLVARAACMLHGAARLVLGVVHGVQPATGSAAAYWRMRAGFPREQWWSLMDQIMARVLGTDGREVTALLGNMPGGLELLPNQLYTDNLGPRAWLEWPESPTTTLTLPRSGDPYAEIYLERAGDWRLIHDESWLDPATAAANRPHGRRRRSAAGTGAWRSYTERIGEVKAFHARLGAQQHSRTVHFYGTGEKTPASIAFDVDWSYGPEKEDGPGGLRGRTAAEYCEVLNAREANRGRFVYYRPKPHNGRTDYTFLPLHSVIRMRMRDPSDYDDGSQDGDGTVPAASGRVLGQAGDPGTCRKLDGFAHDKAYNHAGPRHFASQAIAAWLAERAQAVRAAAS